MGMWQETFGAEVSAITRAVHLLASRHQTGQDFAIFTDSQTAMKRFESDYPGPRQDVAIEVIDSASRIHDQGNTLAVRWEPEHRGVVGHEVADTSAREAAKGEDPRYGKHEGDGAGQSVLSQEESSGQGK